MTKYHSSCHISLVPALQGLKIMLIISVEKWQTYRILLIHYTYMVTLQHWLMTLMSTIILIQH